MKFASVIPITFILVQQVSALVYVRALALSLVPVQQRDYLRP